jgi:hypothetical protein
MLEEESELDVSSTGGLVHNKGEWSDDEILRWLNRADLHLTKKILEASEQYYEETDTSLGFIDGQREYDISGIFGGRLWKVTAVERTDVNTQNRFLFALDQFQDQQQYEGTSIAALVVPFRDRFYIRGKFIGILPTPDSTVANNLKIYFNFLPAKMHVAKAGATPSTNQTTTFTMSASPILGTIIRTTDYYKGAVVEITSGQGIGQRRTITAFNRTTLVATVDSAWDTGGVPNQETVYEIAPQTLDAYQEVMTLYAVKGLLAKENEQYRRYEALYNEQYADLINTIRDRQTSEARRVRYIPDE